MKKYIILLGLVAIAFSSCKKSTPFDPVKQAADDDAAIQAYLKTNNLTATKDASGLYYNIVAVGGDTKPTTASTLTVAYTGKLLNGDQFDSSLSASIFLGNTIDGWKIGIPKIGSGGEILLYIPSALGYGNATVGVIPPNSVMVFDIKLSGFIN